jgi:hypothetical protein
MYYIVCQAEARRQKDVLEDSHCDMLPEYGKLLEKGGVNCECGQLHLLQDKNSSSGSSQLGCRL